MKLEQVITEGIFIKKKLYYIKNSNNQEIIKSSGIESSNLNYSLINKLLQGETITIKRTNFNVVWDNFKINVVSSDIVINGLKEKVKTLYNTPDVNYKYISFPIKYNIIVHPLFPIVKVCQPDIIKLNKNTTILREFSYLEIFIYFIFILSYLLLITFFIYKLY